MNCYPFPSAIYSSLVQESIVIPCRTNAVRWRNPNTRNNQSKWFTDYQWDADSFSPSGKINSGFLFFFFFPGCLQHKRKCTVLWVTGNVNQPLKYQILAAFRHSTSVIKNLVYQFKRQCSITSNFYCTTACCIPAAMTDHTFLGKPL